MLNLCPRDRHLGYGRTFLGCRPLQGGSPEVPFSLRSGAMRWEISRFGALGGMLVPEWSQPVTLHPHILSQSHWKAWDSSLGWTPRRESNPPFHPVSCICLSFCLSPSEPGHGCLCETVLTGVPRLAIFFLFAFKRWKEKELHSFSTSGQRWRQGFWFKTQGSLHELRLERAQASMKDLCPNPKKASLQRPEVFSETPSLRRNFLSLGSAS